MKTSSNHSSSPQQYSVFSRELARDVVKQFVAKYPRATYFTAINLGVDVENLAASMEKMFMYRNRDWNMFRDCVKHVDKRWNVDRPRVLGPGIFKNYLTTTKQELIERWFER